MQLCQQCPSDSSCQICLEGLGAGNAGKKVIPPRPIHLVHLASDTRYKAELRAISRIAVGVYGLEQWQAGRYEVELASDFRIIGSAIIPYRDSPYLVLDIEKVLRKEEVMQRLLVDEFHLWHLSHELEPSAVLTDHAASDEGRQQLIREQLDKLAVLQNFQELRMFIADGDKLRLLGNSTQPEDHLKRGLWKLVAKARLTRQNVRESLFSKEMDQVFDTHVLPLPDETCGIAVLNITNAIAAERKRQQAEWEMYRNVLCIVTKGKLILLQDADLYDFIRQSEMLLRYEIKSPADLQGMRRQMTEALVACDLGSRKPLHCVVAINEAATNVIKYAEGGKVELYHSQADQILRIVVSDEGEGILLHDLPKATLIRGYSTVDTLGAGFHVMLEYSDRILVNSSPQGTKIVLEWHHVKIGS
ncbi:ATP-binding protein [Brevibacillus dissolubilis]|uniref:ATP-binding protein n=1 Tax=Brevibacillus dissolubilis TaxID=1844116 RepID=UPI00159BD0A7|nr:ATP-binding protein [Brevibacillus dissolubilis]